MNDLHYVMQSLGFIVIFVPVVFMFVLGITSLLDRRLSEESNNRLCYVTIVFGLLGTLGILTCMLIEGSRVVHVEVGEWVHITHYDFSIKFVFDRLSVPMVLLSYLLCGTIGTFASRYMHAEPGYNRFFVLYSIFLTGMIFASLGSTIETLFVGWELVGLSSSLLIAFFQERPSPCRNGLRVWIVYRISDAALLLAAIVIHQFSPQGDYETIMGVSSWPEGRATITEDQALLVGSLILIAVAGKSALVPFSGWLPRAMEGPTPSSAIFYGALSVHLGAYLLLRASPLLEASPLLCTIVVVLGLITAIYAYLVGRVQTDIKSALSYASLSQVGIIVAEIGLGFRHIALIHLLGHACLRTLQFVRAPTLLHDYRKLENAIGARLPRSKGFATWLPERFRLKLYRFAMERGYLDTLLTGYVANPFIRFFRWCERIENRWTSFLNGRSSTEAKPDQSTPKQMEHLS
jgi:NADH-quinone oxidoreductase subunit L